MLTTPPDPSGVIGPAGPPGVVGPAACVVWNHAIPPRIALLRVRFMLYAFEIMTPSYTNCCYTLVLATYSY